MFAMRCRKSSNAWVITWFWCCVVSPGIVSEKDETGEPQLFRGTKNKLLLRQPNEMLEKNSPVIGVGRIL